MKKKKIIIKGLILLIWMIVIFLFSHQDSSASTDLSNGFIYKVFKLFNLSDENIVFMVDNVFFVARKCAHFFEYFILGILFMTLLKDLNLSIKKCIIYSILFCLLYAVSDEIHQLFISGRHGSIIDVMVDSLGYLFSILLYYLLTKRKTLSFR